MHIDPLQMLWQLDALVEGHVDGFGEDLELEVGVHGCVWCREPSPAICQEAAEFVSLVVVLPQHLVETAAFLIFPANDHVAVLVHGNVSILVIAVGRPMSVPTAASKSAHRHLLPICLLVLVF